MPCRKDNPSLTSIKSSTRSDNISQKPVGGDHDSNIYKGLDRTYTKDSIVVQQWFLCRNNPRSAYAERQVKINTHKVLPARSQCHNSQALRRPADEANFFTVNFEFKHEAINEFPFARRACSRTNHPLRKRLFNDAFQRHLQQRHGG